MVKRGLSGTTLFDRAAKRTCSTIFIMRQVGAQPLNLLLQTRKLMAILLMFIIEYLD